MNFLVATSLAIMTASAVDVELKKQEDRVTVESKDTTTTCSFTSPSGIGGATVHPGKPRPERMVVRMYLKGLEKFEVSNGKITWQVSVLSHGEHRRLLHLVENGRRKAIDKKDPYWTEIRAFDAKGKPIEGLPGKGGYFEIALPAPIVDGDPKSLNVRWIDFYRG